MLALLAQRKVQCLVVLGACRIDMGRIQTEDVAQIPLGRVSKSKGAASQGPTLLQQMRT